MTFGADLLLCRFWVSVLNGAAERIAERIAEWIAGRHRLSAAGPSLLRAGPGCRAGPVGRSPSSGADGSGRASPGCKVRGDAFGRVLRVVPDLLAPGYRGRAVNSWPGVCGVTALLAMEWHLNVPRISGLFLKGTVNYGEWNTGYSSFSCVDRASDIIGTLAPPVSL